MLNAVKFTCAWVLVEVAYAVSVGAQWCSDQAVKLAQFADKLVGDA